MPGIDKTRILQQLATAGLLATEWGGDVEVVPTSALKGTGINELLDMILTIAELHEYKANPNRHAYGTCLEARLHEGRGVVSTVIVQNGTLKVGDVIVCGSATGRVKAIYDTLDPRKTYESAGPATPVNITGLDTPPGAGDHFYILDDIAQARSIAAKRENRERFQNLGGGTGIHVTLENLHERLTAEKAQTLNVILWGRCAWLDRSDSQRIRKLQPRRSAGQGAAVARGWHFRGRRAVGRRFGCDHHRFQCRARRQSADLGSRSRRADSALRHHLSSHRRLGKALEGMLTPEKETRRRFGPSVGPADVRHQPRGNGRWLPRALGTIERNSRVRIIRDNRVVGDYGLDSLKREKDDAREVREGLECGIKLAGFNDLKEGDVLEAYKVEEVARSCKEGAKPNAKCQNDKCKVRNEG